MRFLEHLLRELDGVRTVVAVGTAGSELVPVDRLPPGVAVQHGFLGTDGGNGGAGKPGLGPGQVFPGSLLVARVANQGRELDLAELPRLVECLQEGARALLLVRRPPRDLPVPRLLDELGRASCQVLRAAPVDDRPGATVVVVTRVSGLRPLPGLLDGGAAAGTGDPGSGGTWTPAAEGFADRGEELRFARRLANEFVVGGLTTRLLRTRVAELEQDAGDGENRRAAADDRARQRQLELAAVRADLLDARRDLAERATELAEVRRQLRALRASAALRAGRAFAAAARSPLRGGLRLPGELYRAWRGPAASAAPAARGEPARGEPAARGGPVASAPRVPVPNLVASPRPVSGSPPPPDRRFRLLVAGSLAAAEEPSRALTIRVPRALHVPKRLQREGLAGFEPGPVACYLALLELAPPGAVFDIGANVGLYSWIAAASSDREVHAFEPTPQSAAAARAVLADNDLSVRLQEMALGSARGTATLFLSDSTDSSNSLLQGFRPSSRQIEVPVDTLDGYVERTGVVPVILKIDTEATEPDVVAGGLETLRRHRPWVLCEVLRDRVEERLQRLLTPLGYTWYHISGDVPLAEQQAIVGDPAHADLMWLLAPQPVDDAMWDAVGRWSDVIERCVPLAVQKS